MACAPCRQHLFGGLKSVIINPRYLVVIALTIIFTVIAVYTVEDKKELGVFSREVKCENAIKNEYGVFISSGDCECDECGKKTTPKTPIDQPVVSKSY